MKAGEALVVLLFSHSPSREETLDDVWEKVGDAVGEGVYADKEYILPLGEINFLASYCPFSLSRFKLSLKRQLFAALFLHAFESVSRSNIAITATDILCVQRHSVLMPQQCREMASSYSHDDGFKESGTEYFVISPSS